jgi:hypothetical protein
MPAKKDPKPGKLELHLLFVSSLIAISFGKMSGFHQLGRVPLTSFRVPACSRSYTAAIYGLTIPTEVF